MSYFCVSCGYLWIQTILTWFCLPNWLRFLIQLNIVIDITVHFMGALIAAWLSTSSPMLWLCIFFKSGFFATRGGVLEDVLGLEDFLKNTFSSPWPWSLKSSKIALSSARGQHYFWTVEISMENARNLAENLQRPFFWFPQVEIAWKKFFEDLFFWDCLKKNFEDLFFLENTCVCVLGLGLETVCPWPRNFFVSLASSLVSSTPPLFATSEIAKTSAWNTVL